MSPAQSTPPVDFSTGLHALRTDALKSLPPGAKSVVHGGAAGRWYFEWFEENYPGTIGEHVCVEKFSDPPADLPGNVRWLQQSLGDFSQVADRSVDMVFAGQVIEHLWPEDIAGFLLESRRVLRSGGHLVMDSPNRLVTQATDWQHPQHTVELSADEACELARLAGLEVIEVRGLLASYTHSAHAFIGADTGSDVMQWDDRATADAPANECFVWWLVATPGASAPDPTALRSRAADLFRQFRRRRLASPFSPLPRTYGAHDLAFVSAPPGSHVFAIHGPYVPIDAGDWVASFFLRRTTEPDPGGASEPVARLDAVIEGGTEELGHRDLFLPDLPESGQWVAADLAFTAPTMCMGAELRVQATGVVGIDVECRTELRAAADHISRPS